MLSSLWSRLRTLFNGGLPINLVAPAQIESFGRFRLPPSATIIEARAQGFLTYSFFAQIAFPAREFDAFIAGTLIRAPLGSDHKPKRMPIKTGAMRLFRAGEAQQGNCYQAILVDTSDSARFVAYIATYSE